MNDKRLSSPRSRASPTPPEPSVPDPVPASVTAPVTAPVTAAAPGIAMSGGICGPVTGGLLALGLYFSSPDIMNHDNPVAYLQARVFLDRFAAALGSLHCPAIQERLLGKYYDPMASPENMKEYFASSARNNCTVAPGIGAAIAAEIIIDSMES